MLVFHDLVGLNEGHVPRFAKQYGQAAGLIRRAIDDYAAEVKKGDYPDRAHSFFMEPEELKKL
ncbi:MAG: 3-methyl-2-oxobutanoate hydroxymethyltransferase [Clostridiales bacterium]|nr:3-methyl-2-oxobutanoate hydroxymethyltransferase [Clostridiales bacterium]